MIYLENCEVRKVCPLFCDAEKKEKSLIIGQRANTRTFSTLFIQILSYHVTPAPLSI
jgi:hypothetical protein